MDFAFLDSGTGGIPYMLELKKKCPGVKCVYLGDTAHFPYGEKTEQEITDCAAKSISLLLKTYNPSAVVIACNTISVTSLKALRKLFPTPPLVGTVPAIKLAASVTQNKRIGLLATNATVRHPYNQRLIAEYASDCKVFSRGDPDLISFVEHRLFFADTTEREKAVQPAIDYFAQNNCDTIILGCTHFTHIAEDIARVAGQGVSVVDSRDGVARQALRVLGGSRPSASNSLPTLDCAFYVTALRNASDEAEYNTLCKKFSIPWGGVVQST